MSLTRATVTVAQRVMTVVNTAFPALLGYGFVFEADRLRQAPSYHRVDSILPLEVQGVGYLGMSVLLALGLLIHNRLLHVAGLAWLTLWTAVFSALLVAAWVSGDATFLGWAFAGYVAAGAWASMLSLLAQER